MTSDNGDSLNEQIIQCSFSYFFFFQLLKNNVEICISFVHGNKTMALIMSIFSYNHNIANIFFCQSKYIYLERKSFQRRANDRLTAQHRSSTEHLSLCSDQRDQM